MSRKTWFGLLACAVGALPLLFLLMLSVAEGWVFPQILPKGYGLGAWTQGLSGDLAPVLGRSLGIALLVATLCTGLATWTGRSLRNSGFGESLLQIAYLPYVFAPVVLAAVLQYFFLRTGLSATLAGVVLAQSLIVYPFATILSYGFWNARLLALENTARTLGAEGWTLWRLVLWPLLRGPLGVVFVQAFLVSWFEYGLTLLIGMGKVQTLPLRVFQYVGEANVYYAAVASVLLVAPPTLLLIVNRRLLFVSR